MLHVLISWLGGLRGGGRVTLRRDSGMVCWCRGRGRSETVGELWGVCCSVITRGFRVMRGEGEIRGREGKRDRVCV